MKKKIILSSALSILLCLSLIVGASFALFTSTDGIDVAVTSGTVSVVATVDGEIRTESLGVAQPAGSFENGGTATYDEANGKLVLSNLMPGDKASFTIKMTNNSNVNVQYRVKWAVTNNEFGDVLKVSVTDENGKTAALTDKTSDWTAWTIPATDADKVKTIDVSVLLPLDAGDEYQNKSLDFVFTVEAVQGNAVVSDVTTGEQLQMAIEMGNTATLKNDIVMAEDAAITIPADAVAVIDLNGHTITGNSQKDNGALITNNGVLSITGGTLTNETVNGAAVINNKGTMTLRDVTIESAPMGATGYPEYAVTTSGKLTVEDGTTVYADRGALRTSAGAELVINGGEFIVSDAADGRDMTLHTVYAYGAGTTVTINGGTFVQNHSSNGGASVICPAGAAINIYGGTFDYAGTAGTHSGVFQNYMGYTAPVKVYGGTFTTKPADKYIAEYYTARQNADGTYTVDAADGVLIARNDAELATAIDTINTNSEYWNTPVTVVLSAGEYANDYALMQYPTWNGATSTATDDQTDVTFIGVEGTLFTGHFRVIGNGNGSGTYTYSRKTVFEKVAFDAAAMIEDENGNRINVEVCSGADNVSFNHCTFSNSTHVNFGGSKYNGTGDISFTDCQFNNSGVLTGGPMTLTITDCIFNGSDNGFVNVQRGGNGAGIVTVKNTKVVAGAYAFRTNALANVTATDSEFTITKVGDAVDEVGALACFRRTGDSHVTFTNCELSYEALRTYKDTATADNTTLTIDGIQIPDNGLAKDANGNYYVYSAEGLMAFRDSVGTWGADTLAGKTVTICADIDAAGKTWETAIIASGSANRNGFTFDGKGHTISNLTIVSASNKTPGTGLFAMNAGNDTPTTFKDITFDNVTVNGGVHTGVLWGQAYGKIVADNVSVINSHVTGTCNVGALIARNGDDARSEITFKNCSVKNTEVTSTGGGDNAGASAFLGMALKVGVNGVSVNLVFEGTNVSEGNTLTTADGQQGGGIYAKATWGDATWDVPVVETGFVNYNNQQ